jgi:hypothetical protein
VVLICAVVSCGAFWFLARRTPDAAVT